MSPWLEVEADSLVEGESVPLYGVDFRVNAADRVTEYRALHPMGPVTLEMLPVHPHQYRDESGLWNFGSWENGSPNRTRTVTITGLTELVATLYKYQQAAPDPIIQANYRRKLNYVRLITHPSKSFAALKKVRDERAVSAQAQLCLFEDKLRNLMDQTGVYSDMHHQYIAYALALDKTQRTMAFMVDLIREHTILRDRFERRGLVPAVLDDIDAMVIYRG